MASTNGQHHGDDQTELHPTAAVQERPMTPVGPADSSTLSVGLFHPAEVTADDIRTALFVKRRPLVKPLFAPGRPVGEPVEFIEAPQVSLVQRVIRFFRA